ncbi:MAG: FKBP-type peptidyl-prolyl cis-trans isomerase [Candidatus Nanopelagicales bacterium]|nr:FKBP-type peptidyl-prolyl cis-trans isomerase [Candidatus Nanopelagicales bacterium]
MTSPLRRTASLAIVPALVFALGACSSSTDSNGGASATASASASASFVTTDLKATDVKVSGAAASLTAEFPHPAQAQTLSTTDLKVGKAAKAKTGDTLTVNYYLASGLTGQKIEASFGSAPQTFKLEAGGLIPGWVKGVPGMQVGGRRVLVVPGADAYAENPPPGSGIQPNETLVFVVDLVGIA